MTVVINGTTGISTPGLSNSSTTTNTGNVTNSGTVTNASTISVGNATPSSSGAGITFPATQSASTDANTLDDYEEGTWTPTLTGSGTWPTISSYNNQVGYYRKVGNLVFISFYIYIPAGRVSGGSGGIQISNLPFNAKGGLNAGYNVISAGYLTINGTAGSNSTTGIGRWQVNADNGSYLSCYCDRDSVWGTGTYELSGAGCYMSYV